MTALHSSPVFSLRVLRDMLVALALMLATVISYAAEWNIDRLMHGLAQTRSDHASFTEKKYIAMLEEPVESSGELFYTAPDHLEKRTLKPKPEFMVLDHDSLVIERGHKNYHLQLQDYPELAAFIDSIRGTLAGDRMALERNYRLSLEGTADSWALQLLPVDEKMQAVVKRIRIAGSGYDVHSIEIIQADNDSSIMLIEKLASP
jgi:outer membrane lipoprotein-sorting protein